MDYYDIKKLKYDTFCLWLKLDKLHDEIKTKINKFRDLKKNRKKGEVVISDEEFNKLINLQKLHSEKSRDLNYHKNQANKRIRKYARMLYKTSYDNTDYESYARGLSDNDELKEVIKHYEG